MIFSSRRNSLLWTVCAVVLVLASSGCRGFFVKPTLNSITVTPSNPSLQVGQTMQLIATGNFSDGSTGSVSNVSWTSGDATHVTVSSSGLIKGIANTTTGVTITATSGAASGSATVTVGQSSTVTVSCNSCSGNTISLTTNGGAGSIVTFTATQGGTDVTSSANWSSSNQSVITTPSAGSATLGGLTGLVTITATTSGGSGSAQITVTP